MADSPIPFWLRRAGRVSGWAGAVTGLAGLGLAQCVALGTHGTACMRALSVCRALHATGPTGVHALIWVGGATLALFVLPLGICVLDGQFAALRRGSHQVG